MSTEVYTGIWINWQLGSITGATLTLSARDGGLMTAFLALFVTVIGARFWRLSCYLIHQLRSTTSEQDINFLQRQVILRNSATPATAAWAFLEQGYQGRNRNRRSLLRSFSWILLAALFASGFGLAAVFSSNISKSMSNARLVKSATCGDWPKDALEEFLSIKMNNDTFTAANYARSCYGGTPNDPKCSRLPIREIPYSMDHNASCPFETGLCALGDTGALKLSTNLIDSQGDLGINHPPEYRVLYQLTKTCAPLTTTDYIVRYNASVNSSDGAVGDRIYQYQFGPLLHGIGRDQNVTTHVVGDHAMYGNGGYVLRAYTSMASAQAANEWTPIPALNRTDADVSIFFLEANTIRFEGTNSDPLFAAHGKSSLKGSNTYFCDNLASVMACAEQYRVCDPLNDVCTPFLGSYQLVYWLRSRVEELDLNVHQLAATFRVLGASTNLLLAEKAASQLHRDHLVAHLAAAALISCSPTLTTSSPSLQSGL